MGESFGEGFGDLPRQQIEEWAQLPRFQCIFRGGDRRPEIRACRPQAGVRRALAGAMQPHRRFHEMSVGKSLCLGPEPAYGCRLLEGGCDLRPSRLRYVGEHQVDIAGVERLDGCGRDRAVDRVAMRTRCGWCQQQSREDRRDGSEYGYVINRADFLRRGFGGSV